MTGPVVVLTTEIAGTLIFAGALVNDSGRTAVLGLVGLVVIACAKWLWGAIVRQIKAAIIDTDSDRYTKLAESIAALSQSNETQHAENGRRLDGIEQRQAVVEANTAIHATRLDDGSKRMAEIISKLGDLSSDVGRLRSTQLANSPKESSDAQ